MSCLWPFSPEKHPGPTGPPIVVTTEPQRASPSPIVPTLSLQMGVYSFGGFAKERTEFDKVTRNECPYPEPWKSLKRPDRHMGIGENGEYDQADPAVTLEILDLLHEHKVDYVVYQQQWSHLHAIPALMGGWPDIPSPLLMSHSADNHPENHPVKFACSNWDVNAKEWSDYWVMLKAWGWTAAEILESWGKYGQTVAQYMLHPRYLHVDDGPVLFRGHAHTLPFYEEHFGVVPKQIIDVIKEEVFKVTGKELYLMACATEPVFRPQLKGIGFTGLTEYLLESNSWANVMKVYEQFRAEWIYFCRREGLKYWIPASTGFDPTAWGIEGHSIFIPTALEYAEHLRECRKAALENYDVTDGMVITEALDEIGEGSILLKMAARQLHDGDEMLMAHKAAAS